MYRSRCSPWIDRSIAPHGKLLPLLMVMLTCTLFVVATSADKVLASDPCEDFDCDDPQHPENICHICFGGGWGATGDDDYDKDGIHDLFCDNCDPNDFCDTPVSAECAEQYSNASQLDTDGDGWGDACDNCPFNDNEDQANNDNDSLGDACDNCDYTDNEDQADTDGDEIGDVCDTCTDSDEDDYGDPGLGKSGCSGATYDNCPYEYNPDQADENQNGIGDACDSGYITEDGDAIVHLEFTYDQLNRAVEIRRNDLELVTYQYEGLNMTRRRVRTEYLDLAFVGSPQDAYIDYKPEYDDHRRITKITNLVASAAQGATDRGLATYTYEFDNAGNRITQGGVRNSPFGGGDAGFGKARDIDYTYDRLHRVTQAIYSAPDTSTGNMYFDYDRLGNRDLFYDSLNGVILYQYAHNAANEYTEIVVNAVTQPYLYDDRGNLSRDNGFDDQQYDFFEYSYDLENRLTLVEYDYDGDGNDLTGMAHYRYDALGRRIEYIDETREMTLRYYYDGQNVIAEYDYDDSRGQGEEQQILHTYVNGTQFIDERVLMRDHIQDPVAEDDQVGQDHYYLLKDLYTVAGVVARNGNLEEMYTYDTYGQVTIHEWPIGDVNLSGTVTNSGTGNDYSLVLAALFDNDEPLCDMNLDGGVTGVDMSIVYDQADAGATTAQCTYSSVDNPFFFTGRLTDTLDADNILIAEDPYVRRLQDNRNRTYDPKHARWLQRDPLGIRPDAPKASIYPEAQYTDGMNLYNYIGSHPTNNTDPFGLDVRSECYDPCLDICWIEFGRWGYSYLCPLYCYQCCYYFHGNCFDDDDGSPPDPGTNCGVVMKQIPLCAEHGYWCRNLGHTWLELPFGETVDWPMDYIEGKYHKCQKKYVYKEWKTRTSASNTRTCGKIFDCLRSEEKSANDKHPLCLILFYNCRTFADQSLRKCGLETTGPPKMDTKMPEKYCRSKCSMIPTFDKCPKPKPLRF